jgi:hypothetical protein
MSNEPAQAPGPRPATPESTGQEQPIVVNVSVGSPDDYTPPSLAAGQAQRRRPEDLCLCKCGSQSGAGSGG